MQTTKAITAKVDAPEEDTNYLMINWLAALHYLTLHWQDLWACVTKKESCGENVRISFWVYIELDTQSNNSPMNSHMDWIPLPGGLECIAVLLDPHT